MEMEEEMSNGGRISESDLLLPTLNVLAAQSDGRLSTARLIDALIEVFDPQGEDAETLEGRQDTKFSQIVRNMVSHRTTPGNIIAEGLVIYSPDGGLEITAAGRSRLAKG